MLLTLFYFTLALLILIIVHEAGHFLVARWCGVKVLRFSFGFGKVLASWHDKRGTEYTCSLIPLGGYVKMLDEDEGAVLPEEQHLAFNRQPLLKRVAIVLAGPLFNFLLAFLLLWVVLMIGIKSLAPIIDGVYPNSIAAAAGLTAKQEIIGFNQKKISSWHDFQYALMPLIGSQQNVVMMLKSLQTGQNTTVNLSLKSWTLDPKSPDILKSLGIIPFMPVIPPVVGALTVDSPAALAGIKPNDVIVAIDNEPIYDWLALVQAVRAHPDEQKTLSIVRNGQRFAQPIHIGHRRLKGKNQGFLGLNAKVIDFPQNWLRIQRQNPIQALYLAFGQTVELTKGTFLLMGRLLTGHVSIQSISGPIGIAHGASESARNGFVYYLSFIALLSISLGAINLMPIPMLDGGHLFFYLIEVLMRKPLSTVLKAKSTYVGLILIMALTVIAFTNDLSRLIFNVQ